MDGSGYSACCSTREMCARIKSLWRGLQRTPSARIGGLVETHPSVRSIMLEVSSHTVDCAHPRGFGGRQPHPARKRPAGAMAVRRRDAKCVAPRRVGARTFSARVCMRRACGHVHAVESAVRRARSRGSHARCMHAARAPRPCVMVSVRHCEGVIVGCCRCCCRWGGGAADGGGIGTCTKAAGAWMNDT
jgi:hypothetical protein